MVFNFFYCFALVVTIHDDYMIHIWNAVNVCGHVYSVLYTFFYKCSKLGYYVQSAALLVWRILDKLYITIVSTDLVSKCL